MKNFSHTILLATHDTDMALELCPRPIVLEKGQIVADYPTIDLASSTDDTAILLFRKPMSLKVCNEN